MFFYAPMIFVQSGIGTDAAFLQAVLVGLVNLTFTLLAIAFIDRVGRRRLLLFGVTGVAVSMLVIAWGFFDAVYLITPNQLATLAIGDADLTPLLGKKIRIRFWMQNAYLFGFRFANAEDLDKINDTSW